MPRKSTGTVIRTKAGLWQAVVTLADGSRKRIPPFPAGTSEKMAREKAAHYAERVKELGLESATKAPKATKAEASGSLAQAWIDTWHAERVARGLSSARVSKGHWSEHLSAILGKKHPRNWTQDDFRAVSKSLDEKVQRGVITWKTASNVWATATKLADDSRSSKSEAIRCRTDNVNPCDGVRGPDRGEQIARQFLYPSEFVELMTTEAVPLEWRRIFAIGVYTYTRLAELLALTWDDVDLLHGTISISKSIDSNDNARTASTVKTTKSKAPRRIAIEPGLHPLLVAMRAETQGKGRVVLFPRARRHADSLREFLKTAGVNRAALFDRSPSVKPIRFHDLRATGITWMAVRGDEPLRIQQRAGHTDFATTQIYVRMAEEIGAGFGQPFPVLPDCLWANRNTGKDHPPFAPDPQMTKTGCLKPVPMSLSVGAAGFEPATSSV